MQNGFAKTLIDRLRDELLNKSLFATLGEARQETRAWRCDYSHQQSHSGLQNMRPAESTAKKRPEMRTA